MSITHKFNIENREVKTNVISSEAQLDQCLSDFLSTISKDTRSKRVVGLNIEKEYETKPSMSDNNLYQVHERSTILTLCFGNTCLIIQLLSTKLGSLSKFLQLPQLSFVSVGIRHCLEALERDHGIKCRNAVDLAQLAATVKETEIYRAYGLVDLADKVCLLDVKKMMSSCTAAALTNWGDATLSPQQVEAATRSAFSCFCVGNRLFGGVF